MIRTWRQGAWLWLLLVVVLTLFGYGEKKSTYIQQISTELSEQLPTRIRDVFKDVYISAQPERLFIQKVNRDLAQVWRHESQCSVRMLSVNTPHPREFFWPFSRQILVPWQLGDKPYQSSFVVTCQYPWLWMLLKATSLAAVMVVLLWAMPPPLSAARAHWMNQLMVRGESLLRSYGLTSGVDQFSDLQQRLLKQLLQQSQLSVEQAISALQPMPHLTEDEAQWFLLGMQRYQDVDKAIAVASAGDRLVFDCDREVVSVHGVEVKLAKTPFYYYLWYAGMRQQGIGDGWRANPSSQRPDTEAAQALIELMTAFSGHQRAIKELQHNGLRAKTLDQNRNKIKDELQEVLGETLAKNFLFDSSRDPKSGRSSYRLALSRECIEL